MTRVPALSTPPIMRPVLARMRSLATCSPEFEAQVLALGGRFETVAAKTVVWAQETSAFRPRYLLSGWACRYRHLPDGRRQIFDIALPGDGLGVRLHPNPIANASIMALTPLSLVNAGSLLEDRSDHGSLAIFHAQANTEEERALRQMMRLGRMSAMERLADLFIELHERLEVIGHTEGARYACPLTQETLADLTGLSVVHVNRTLQDLRRKGLVVIERGWVQIGERQRLAEVTELAPRRAVN